MLRGLKHSLQRHQGHQTSLFTEVDKFHKISSYLPLRSLQKGLIAISGKGGDKMMRGDSKSPHILTKQYS